jgi:hypothetical protein
MKKFSFLGALGLLLALALMPGGAKAGVATSGAVLLDPFDPVPEIQFRHYGGYGCSYGCGGCDYECGGYRDRCDRGCYRHSRCGDGCSRHSDCDNGCYRRTNCDDTCRSHCDRDCDDHDGDRGDGGHAAAPCTQANCYDAEHYERRWRDGDRVGQEWMDRGRKERIIPADAHPHGWGHGGEDWHDDDDDAPPPAPPPDPPHHH